MHTSPTDPLAKIAASAAEMGLTYDCSRLAGTPRWEFRGKYLISAEDVSEALQWASREALNHADEEHAGETAEQFLLLAEHATALLLEEPA